MVIIGPLRIGYHIGSHVRNGACSNYSLPQNVMMRSCTCPDIQQYPERISCKIVPSKMVYFLPLGLRHDSEVS